MNIKIGPLTPADAQQLQARLQQLGHHSQLEQQGSEHYLALAPAALAALEQDHARQQQQHWQQGEPANSGISWLQGWRLPAAGAVTYSILAACVLVFVLQQLAPIALLNGLHFFKDGNAMTGAQQWRWFTPVLLHFSLIHLLFNLLWWWQLGGVVERREGSRTLFGLLLLAAVFPNLLQWQWAGSNFGGLSGVVYALLGYVWLAGKLNPMSRLSLPNGIAVLMLLWLAWGFVAFIGPSMANGAHFGGLLTGLLVALMRHHPFIRKGIS